MATPKKQSSSFSRGSEEEYSLVCLPCHRDRMTVPAFGFCQTCKEHLCQPCYRHHKKATPSRHHKLQDKDAMPTTQQLTDTVVYRGSTDNLTTPCPHHKKEMIKLYCHDHQLLLCSICVARDHTKSCHVDYIPDVSDKMINSKDYKHMLDRMDKLQKKCTTTQKETSNFQNKSKESLKQTLQEINKYRQTLNKRLDELQKATEDELQAIQHQNIERIKITENLCDNVKKAVQATYDTIKRLNTSKQSDLLFMEIKRAQKELHDYENDIVSSTSHTCIDEYKFHQSQAIDDLLLKKEKMLGAISTKPGTKESLSSHLSQQPPSSGGTITPTGLSEICVKSSKDKWRCGISGMTVLSPDKLVLADSENRSIKLVDVNSKSIISQLSLGTYGPWDITSTSSTQVAVTVPHRQHIQFITVSDNKLSKSHTIQTDAKCYYICCHQDKLIVTYCNPGKLEIMNMIGRYITKVETDSNGEEVFVMPLYVQANSSSIYVSDASTGAVIILNWNGEVTGRITDAGDPVGMALLDDGSLIVCGYLDRVYQVSGSTSSSIVLQDVARPRAVCVDDRRHKLYISRCAGEDRLSNNILIYNI